MLSPNRKMDFLQQKLEELQFLIDWKAPFQWSQVQKTVTSQDDISGTEHEKAERNGPPHQPHEARLQRQPGDARPERASLTMRVGVASRERKEEGWTYASLTKRGYKDSRDMRGPRGPASRCESE